LHFAFFKTMSNKFILTGLKILFTLALCVLFGFAYGKFINLFSGLVDFNSRWVYFVLAIPIFLPIFEYIRTEYKKRPDFYHLIKEVVYTFISALIVVAVLINFEFGGEYQDFVMSIIGLALVIVIANTLNFGVNKALAKLSAKKSK